MPEVSSLDDAVTFRLVVYQLFVPNVPLGFKDMPGATLSSQNDFEEEVVRPALSMARISSECFPSGRANTPETGKAIQLLLSRLYSNVDNPEPGVGSDAEAFSTAEVYQLFEPSVPPRPAFSAGFCVSSEAYCVSVRIFPALSLAVSTSICAPSPLIVIDEQEPSAAPSNVHVKLARPDVTSEAEPLKEIGLKYHPFEPDVPLNVPAILGNWESTFALNVLIVELSPNDESAQ